MLRSLYSLFFQSALCCLITVVCLQLTFAQVMQSSNYHIQSDSINFAGGFSSSSNYVLESTAGEIATGDSQSTSYKLKAGFQQMQSVYIALSGVTDVVLSPAIAGVSGGVANGSTTIRVTTDSPAGYELTLAATTNPAMQKTPDSIADYTPAGAPPDFTFTTGVADAHFGYTPEGTHIVQRFKDNGATCNTGSLDTSLSCWDGLSTTAETIASSVAPNHPNGSTTTVRFRVGVGSSVAQTPGVYIATTTVTAIPL